MKKLLMLVMFFVPFFLHASDYNDGLDAMRERKYERAIDRFSRSLDKEVMKGYVTAAKVKEQMAKAQAGYLNELNIKITESDREKKYKDTLSLVNRGLKVIPDNARLSKLKGEYEDKIKDLEAKVKEGEVLINNKDWVAAYNYFQKLRPYEDTVSAIGSNYRKAKDEIIDSYVNAAKVDEKNFDFVSAKKEYEKALAYDQKDKSLNRKIKEVTERIGAQEMLAKGKALSDQGQKEKAFEMLKDAHKKDEDNKEITIYMNVLKDDVAKLWMDRAIDLEAKGQYKDAYSTVVKAEEVGSDMKDVKAGIETAKKSIILNYARSFAEKADGLKNNDEEAYIYYIASYALNSEDKAVQDKIKGLEQTLKDKTCYNLGIRTTVSPKTKMDKDTLSKVDEMIKTELGSFAKDKCINIAEPTKGDQGYLLNTVLTYKSETKGSMITIKLDLESEATDLATKKGLAKTRKMDLYAGEAAKTNEVKVEDDMVNKVVRNVVSELKDSNLRYYGDRYYTFFNTAKDPRSKMSNAVLTFIAKRYLSDERLFSDNAVKYITKTYGVNIDRKRMETLDKSK